MTIVLLTCEHAAYKLPDEFSELMNIPPEILTSHRGWDQGAYIFYNHMSNFLKCKSFAGDYSRLLIDLNRSIHSKNLYSQFSGKLPHDTKKKILEKYYLPYRRSVESFTNQQVKEKRKVVHLSLHSFTPELHGQTRNADVGLLYDPRRVKESELAEAMKKELLAKVSALRIRRNYPYLGVSDGITSFLRKKFTPQNYLGFEIELNQNLFSEKKKLYSEIENYFPDIIQRLIH